MAEIEHGTLVANTLATVTLDRDFAKVEVLNRDGAAEIFFTVDGAAPTVEGDDCQVLPAAIGALELLARETGQTIVRLISSGTPKYSVRGFS